MLRPVIATARARRALARALLVAALALLLAAPGARALDPAIPPTPVLPADGDLLLTRQLVMFRVAAQPGEDALWLRVSRSPATDERGLIGFDVELAPFLPSLADPDAYDPNLTFFDYDGYWMKTPGIYYWQAYRITYANGADGAVEGPVRSFTLVDPTPPEPKDPPSSEPPIPDAYAGLTFDLIPRWVASQRRSYRFVVSRWSPALVAPARWHALVESSARRWGMRVVGRIATAPRHGNRRNEIGFSTRVPRSALGVQTATVLRRIATVSVCGPVRCRLVRRVVSRRVIDRDVTVAPNRRWQPGPDPPGLREFDLQTTLIHELGHAAGNDHRPRCVNSPMVRSLRPGEWWRAPDDFRWRGCGRLAATSSARNEGSLLRRTIYVDVPVGAGRQAVAARLAQVAARAGLG